METNMETTIQGLSLTENCEVLAGEGLWLVNLVGGEPSRVPEATGGRIRTVAIIVMSMRHL